MPDAVPYLESCIEQGVLVLTIVRRQIEGDEKVLEQVLDHPHLVVQPVIALEQVQRAAIGVGKAYAVLVGHYVIAPALP